jgi:carboxypeptidase C (cathepsin A)
MKAVENVNPYMTIGTCYTPDASEFILGQYKSHRFNRARFNIPDNKKMLRNVKSGSDSPCTDDIGITNYFNKDTVRAQLHIKRADQWTPCSEKVGNNYHMSNSSLSFFPTFKQKGLKVLLYSGNVDAVVPYVETEEYIKQIGWKQTSPKKNLVNARGSLMGWQVEYEGLTYVIINGAGHMVPSDKPHAAYEMFKSFIGANKDEVEVSTL